MNFFNALAYHLFETAFSLFRSRNHCFALIYCLIVVSDVSVLPHSKSVTKQIVATSHTIKIVIDQSHIKFKSKRRTV